MYIYIYTHILCIHVVVGLTLLLMNVAVCHDSGGGDIDVVAGVMMVIYVFGIVAGVRCDPSASLTTSYDFIVMFHQPTFHNFT